MIPLAEMSLAGRIFPCVPYGVFHPACRDEILLLALAKYVHFIVMQHNYLTFLAFFFIYLQEKALL